MNDQTPTINGLTISAHAAAYAEALVRYGKHKQSCGGTVETCDCGFQKAYDQANALLLTLNQMRT